MSLTLPNDVHISTGREISDKILLLTLFVSVSLSLNLSFSLSMYTLCLAKAMITMHTRQYNWRPREVWTCQDQPVPGKKIPCEDFLAIIFAAGEKRVEAKTVFGKTQNFKSMIHVFYEPLIPVKKHANNSSWQEDDHNHLQSRIAHNQTGTHAEHTSFHNLSEVKHAGWVPAGAMIDDNSIRQWVGL